ncbi:hypothetical protein KR018_001298, partial [Drosophila ironensis]
MRPSTRLLFVLLGLAVGCFADDGTDNPCQNVRLAGFVCLNCTTLGYCIHDASGQWQTVSMLGCQSEHNFFCSDDGTFGCTWQSRCQVPQRGPFSCQQPGLFPDPYDCRKYHECSELNVDTPRQCVNGAGYSTLTENCVLPRESEQCATPQFSCSRSGQIGGWPGDSRFYYICMNDTPTSFYPVMMKCHDGFVFQNYGCVSSSTRHLQLPGTESVPECANGYNYECEGSPFCKCVDGKLQPRSCPNGFYFDAKILSCRSDNDRIDCRDFEVLACPSGTATNEYCLCMIHQLEIKSCPLGEVFNEHALLCMKVEE